MKMPKIKHGFGKVSLILVFVCIALIAVDIVLKYLEEAQGWNFTVIPGFIWVESGHRNSGAAFSMLSGNTVFLTVFSIVLLAVMVTAFVFVPDRFVLLKVAMSMIIAGAIGNLYDRAAFGEVRDFVWVNMGFSTACCNFADFFIVFGVIIAVIDFLFLNEWAVVPLTKRAKQAQAKQKNKDEGENGGDGESGD